MSARRAPLHRKASKCWLYWTCPTQCRFVMLVKMFNIVNMTARFQVHAKYLRKLLLVQVYIKGFD